MALGGPRFINIFNNLMEVGVWGRRCIEEDTRLGRNVWVEIIFLFGVVN